MDDFFEAYFGESDGDEFEDIKVDKNVQTTIGKEQSQVKKMGHKDDIDNCKTILKDKIPFSRKYFTKLILFLL